jgi:GNAT superfamily N-acetyltransferase
VTDVVLRPAEATDGDAIGDLYTATREAAVPLMPPALHTNAEDRAFFGAQIGDGRHEVWVAERAGEVVAFASFTRTWLDALYVHPDHQGGGIGGALVALVQSLRPEGLGLWVFESNLPARGLYASYGFTETLRTDGADNEEHAPDIRMDWSA